jgi:hypothetical protein
VERARFPVAPALELTFGAQLLAVAVSAKDSQIVANLDFMKNFNIRPREKSFFQDLTL